MAGEDWYIQRDGVAMGAAMSVILANVWMKTFEPALSSEMPEPPKKPDNCCGKCGVKVTFRGYSIRCKVCCKSFYRKCTPFTVGELKRMTTSSWFFGCTVDEPRKARVFSWYMDDILRSAKPENITGILERVNKLRQNLEFTIERQQTGSLPFLDLSVKQTGADVDTTWYRKPTDTGLTLSFRALAPMRYKKNIEQGTVHRVFNASSNWHAFTESITEVGCMLEKNQNPPQFFEPIIRETLN